MLPFHHSAAPRSPHPVPHRPPLRIYIIIMSAVVAAVPGTEEVAIEIKKPAPKVSEISSRRPEAGVLCCPLLRAVACPVLTRLLPPLYLLNRSLLQLSWSSEPWRAWWVPFASSLLVRAGDGMIQRSEGWEEDEFGGHNAYLLCLGSAQAAAFRGWGCLIRHLGTPLLSPPLPL